MKRRYLILLFFFATALSCSGGDPIGINSREQRRLDLQDCDVMKVFARTWKSTPLVQEERAVWIVNSNGKYSGIDWLRSPQNRITVWSAPLPDNVVAQAHTHGDHLDPKPSDPDIEVARKLNIWVYTLTRKGIWRAGPDGNVTQEAARGWYDQTIEKCGED